MGQFSPARTSIGSATIDAGSACEGRFAKNSQASAHEPNDSVACRRQCSQCPQHGSVRSRATSHRFKAERNAAANAPTPAATAIVIAAQ